MFTAYYARILAKGYSDRLYDLARVKIEAAARNGEYTCLILLKPKDSLDILLKHLHKRGYSTHIVRGDSTTALRINWEIRSDLAPNRKSVLQTIKNFFKFNKTRY